jgi:hypothetical protein
MATCGETPQIMETSGVNSVKLELKEGEEWTTLTQDTVI